MISCPALSPGRSLTFSRKRFSGDGQAIAVEQALASSSILITAGMPPTPCRSSMTYLPLGLKSARQRHAIADALKVVDRERNVDRPRHGDQMQHGVGRAAQHR